MSTFNAKNRIDWSKAQSFCVPQSFKCVCKLFFIIAEKIVNPILTPNQKARVFTTGPNDSWYLIDVRLEAFGTNDSSSYFPFKTWICEYLLIFFIIHVFTKNFCGIP